MEAEQAQDSLRLLRIDQVEKLVPFRRGAIYRRIRERRFPSGVLLGRARVWTQESINEFILVEAGHSATAADMAACHQGRDAYWQRQRSGGQQV